MVGFFVATGATVVGSAGSGADLARARAAGLEAVAELIRTAGLVLAAGLESAAGLGGHAPQT